MQAVPPRGHQALPQGRALPHREVRDRAAQLPARASTGAGASSSPSTCSSSARSRRRAATTACSRSSSGSTTTRRRGAPASPARSCCGCSSSARQRRLPARLRGLARPGAAAHPSRPLPGQRAPREHPELPGAAGTIVVTCKAGSPVEQVVRDATDLTASVAALDPGRPRQPHGQDPEAPERDEIDAPVQEQLIVELYTK